MKQILNFKRQNCHEPIPINDFNAVKSLVLLYSTVISEEKNKLGSIHYDSMQESHQTSEKWFVFCLVWSVMSAVDGKGRIMLDNYFRDIESIFPPHDTIYDFYVDAKLNDFVRWERKIPKWIPQQDVCFHQIFVPTINTTRTIHIFTTFIMQNYPVLLAGDTGLGKTTILKSMIGRLPDVYTSLQMNFSSATSSGMTQAIIESNMVKRSKDTIGPSGDKKLVIFIDDFNMPKKSGFESPFQPPLELIRMLIDYSGWYDKKKCSWKHVLDTRLVCAMAPPGGGREVISNRTKSRFYIQNYVEQNDLQIISIFQTILLYKLRDFELEVKDMIMPIIKATMTLYSQVLETFLPTPSKSFYLFNLRDVAKVIQGIIQLQADNIRAKEIFLRVWVHECMRSFSDRFTKDKTDDETKFTELLGDILKEDFDTEWSALMNDAIDKEKGPIFVKFVNKKLLYDEITNFDMLQRCLLKRLEDYNSDSKYVPMNLVLFRDAIRQVCRIHRILNQDRGNMMLIGVGGSGRQSLARLACFVAQIPVTTIEVTNKYRAIEFLEDFKVLYFRSGIENKKVVFFFSDSQIKEETFLEFISNFLSSGEIPNLYSKDEVANVCNDVRFDAIQAGYGESTDALWNFFINRVRANLHVILTMSPIGTFLRTRTQMFPSLVTCTHIISFNEWPDSALQEVSMKFLRDVGLGGKENDKIQNEVSDAFAAIHLSTINISEKMTREQKRYNYITPTNYLEFVKGYLELLKEKQRKIGSQKSKLFNGLKKLVNGKDQVENMSIELEQKKNAVSSSQKECEEMLKVIVMERRVAETQKEQVEAEAIKIGKEEHQCKMIATDAETDLAVALPALEKAMQEVEKLDKNSISEIKGYSKPPPAVEKVLSCVMTLLRKPIDWASSKKVIGETSFLSSLKSFDKANVKDSIIIKVKKYVTNPSFAAEEISKISKAAGALCFWCHAIYIYAGVAKDVAPKRARLKAAQNSLTVKQKDLAKSRNDLRIIVRKVEKLKKQYDTSVEKKNRLKLEADDLESILSRAEKLINGLSGEFTRWQQSVLVLERSLTNLIGDTLIASGFMSYAGPFDTAYRKMLMKQWTAVVQKKKIPFSDNFSFSCFLSDPSTVRDWNIQGLPTDNYSTENAVIVSRCRRWPLLIDPQGQASKWVRKMENEKLSVIDLKMKDFLRVLENAVSNGLPVLLQDIQEVIDPSLEPILSKSTIKRGNRNMIKVGDRETDYSKDFRFYISTKLGNPHFAPEISTKTTVINFSVKQKGLEDQLLGIVVNHEEPSLENQKSDLTLRISAGNKKLIELEDQILRKLADSKGSLLDDVELVHTLQVSKVTAAEVAKQLETAKETEGKIDLARDGYRDAAIISSIVYLVLSDMSKVDSMYQYSLDAYSDLFKKSIYDSKHQNCTLNENLCVSKRVQEINQQHLLSMYKWTCVGLFERHKLLFSLQLCFTIMKQKRKIPDAEFDFFCRGGAVLDRSEQKYNQFRDWINESMWDNLHALEALDAFNGLIESCTKKHYLWKEWYRSRKPEEIEPPDEWGKKLNSLQKMCLIRALRPDRVIFAASQFVAENLAPEFAEPPPFNLPEIYSASTNKTPLIFILTPGVDPAEQVQQLAKKSGRKFVQVALGQGQGPVAHEAMKEALLLGSWVLLANCHLMLNWMIELEKMVDTYCENDIIHENYRLWLSSCPNICFPMSLLQRGIKMTTEPPSGLVSQLISLRIEVTI